MLAGNSSQVPDDSRRIIEYEEYVRLYLNQQNLYGADSISFDENQNANHSSSPNSENDE